MDETKREEETKPETPDANGKDGESKPRRRGKRGKDGNGQQEKGVPKSVYDTQLAYDVTRFPFSGAVGRPLDVLTPSTSATPALGSADQRIPGIAAYGLVPSIGYSGNSLSAINLAAKNLYSYVTHANSRNASYEANDLMLYVLATSELFALWAHGVRAYGVARNYSALNKYMPETLLHAMGFNPSDILVHINDLRSGLNLLASKLTSIVIPSNLHYVMMALNKYTTIYADSENSRAQLMLFVPDAYYQYQDAGETGGSLSFTAFTRTITGMNVSTYLSIINSAADAILQSQYMNIIAADIIKAFGTQLYSLNEIAEDYTVTPVYSYEMMETFSNVKPLPLTTQRVVGSFDVTQVIPTDPNSAPWLQHKPQIKVSSTLSEVNDYVNMKVWLNTHYDELTPAQVVDRTAFSPYIQESAVGADTISYYIFGRTSLCNGIRMYNNPVRNVATGYSVQDIQYPVAFTTAGTMMANASAFDNHPLIAVVSKGTSSDTFMNMFGDVDNIVFISKDEMAKLNDAVLQLEYNVGVGLISK